MSAVGAAAAVFMNPLPTLNQFPALNNIHRKKPFYSPAFVTLKEPVAHRKSVRPKKEMAAGSIETGIVGGGGERSSPAFSAFEHETLIDNSGVSIHQTAGWLHTILNRSSKWVVAMTFGGVLVLRHDALALWAAMGSVLNVILSITLKQILKQDRPVSDVSSGHGMPSSHAQSIFYSVVFLILSVVEGLGLNGVSVILSLLLVALGSYFSWLRVFLRYHTTSQVVVGAAVGSFFSVLWFWAWDAGILNAYNSNLWVQILLIVGAVCFCLGFISHVFQHWMNDDEH